jgi:hypothetical protein
VNHIVHNVAVIEKTLAPTALVRFEHPILSILERLACPTISRLGVGSAEMYVSAARGKDPSIAASSMSPEAAS